MYIDIYLNQIAQGLVDIKTGQDWFKNLGVQLQWQTLEKLAYFLLQMKCNNEDIRMSISCSGLKESYTPCVLLNMVGEINGKQQNFKEIINKVLDLPKDENIKTFILLINLFKVVYSRKILECENKSRYWWYLDLSNSEVVDNILVKYKCLPVKNIPNIYPATNKD